MQRYKDYGIILTLCIKELKKKYHLKRKTSFASSVIVPLTGSTKKLNLEPVAVVALINAFHDSQRSTWGANVAQ